MKGRTFRRCASCGRSPGVVAAGRRCPTETCNGRVTWAWSINLGRVRGKRRRLTGSSDEWGENFQTEAVAREGLDKKLQILAGSEDPDRLADAAKLILEDYLAQWLRVRRTSGLRVSTVSANGAHIRLYIVPELGQVKLRRLSRTAVKAWAARLQTDYQLKPGTALNAVRTLSKALSDAVEDGLLDRNVAFGILCVRKEDREVGSAWSPDEARRFPRSHVYREICSAVEAAPNRRVSSRRSTRPRLAAYRFRHQDNHVRAGLCLRRGQRPRTQRHEDWSGPQSRDR